MTLPSANCMTMTDGTPVDLLNPDLSKVSIEQIAAGLSKMCRFNCQCEPFYSVAQHCVLVSNFCRPEDALWGLLHDVWEAFWGDDTRPKKGLLGRTGQAYELKGDQAVAARFGLSAPVPPSVKAVDDKMLATEHRDLRKGPLIWHGPDQPPEPYPWRIQPYDSMETARWRFLDRYYQLTKSTP